MEYRPLGGSDLRVSIVGFGAWPLGGGSGWEDTDEAEGIATVHAAIDAGINFFDTAELYNEGQSEIVLGKALAGKRDQVIIASKVCPWNAVNPDSLRASCEASLKRLNTDYLDLYQIHWPIPDETVDAAVDTLQALRKEGKIRTMGVSNFGVQQLDRIVWTGAPIASNQVAYNLATRAIEFEVMPSCRKYGISIIAYMGLMQGLLAGIYPTADDVPEFRAGTRHFRGGRGRTRHSEPGFEKEVFTMLDGMRAISAESGIPMAQLAYGWIVSHKSVSSTLMGGRKRSQLVRNLESLQSNIPADVLQALDDVSEELKQGYGPYIDMWEDKSAQRSF